MARVEISDEARADMEDVTAYIAHGSHDAARRFVDSALAAFDNLADNPLIGRRRRFAHRELGDVRTWPLKGFLNYLVFYVPIEGGVRIVRVLHGARDIDRLF